MRICAIVITGFLVSGCGLVNSSSMPPIGDPQMLTPGASVLDQSQIFDDSLIADESETAPPKTTRSDPKPIKLLSPKWAKEDVRRKKIGKNGWMKRSIAFVKGADDCGCECSANQYRAVAGRPAHTSFWPTLTGERSNR
jgi:hypothetical protein